MWIIDQLNTLSRQSPSTYFFPVKRSKLLILGLKNAGKSTLLRTLAENRQPGGVGVPAGSEAEELVIGNVVCATLDVDGIGAVSLQRHVREATALMFVVDVADRGGIERARGVLRVVFEGGCAVPVVILGNKMDREDAVSETVLWDRLGLSDVADRGRFELFMCSVVRNEGYSSALRWLAHRI